jgi:2-succinyl-5-enolpyruvyl-6-hydroxy-3-cyclohexene-1-carboxylate synthase
MVLTTIDTAENRARTAPSGPVLINCSFGESVAGMPAPWNKSCLEGMERWTTSSTPCTQYYDAKLGFHGESSPTFSAGLEQVSIIIRSAKKGLLVISSVSAPEETWAVARLAQHLGWPVVSDVRSGLRIQEVLHIGGAESPKVNVIHNLDQILQSKGVAKVSNPDVVLQVSLPFTILLRNIRFLECTQADTNASKIFSELHPYEKDTITFSFLKSALRVSWLCLTANSSADH